MKRCNLLALLLLTYAIPSVGLTAEHEIEEGFEVTERLDCPTQPSFSPFTGRVTRSRVRLRCQSHLDAQVLKEANRGDLFIVSGETADFYAVEPPAETKAYVFRTYVLDGVVEGSHVNVRLEPSLEAPVIAQLNAGDRVQGQISPLNSKWLEIKAPKSARFYVAKEFIENVGDPSYYAMQQERKEKVQSLLEMAQHFAKEELQKSFLEIDFEQIASNYLEIITQFSDDEDAVKLAKELLSQAQTDFIDLKGRQQETLAMPSSTAPLPFNLTGTEPRQALHALSREWAQAEEKLYEAWEQEHVGLKMDDFYHLQFQTAEALTGIVETYDKPIHNKPGNYLLLDPKTKRPIAYLYSTKINLFERVGQKTTILASPRPNNHFAFPAFYALEVE
ncbi:MAG: hypothetical protein K0S07_795 [Chlamydiales bacterium]|jgi:hypothetical protein|nr:hypothetical protein [Chlamydiales bacterium]